jgi:thioredoxin-related protein
MKPFILAMIAVFASMSLMQAQTEQVKIYNPDADAKADIAAAIKKAKAENKHVVLMIGGNWCPWCVKLHGFIGQDMQIDSLIKADYIWVMVNYSKENKNLEVLKELEYPQRFGFPVLIVLDQKGRRLHTQDSWYLEKDKFYDKEKLMHFLKMWSVNAVDPKNYAD